MYVYFIHSFIERTKDHVRRIVKLERINYSGVKHPESSWGKPPSESARARASVFAVPEQSLLCRSWLIKRWQRSSNISLRQSAQLLETWADVRGAPAAARCASRSSSGPSGFCWKRRRRGASKTEYFIIPYGSVNLILLLFIFYFSFFAFCRSFLLREGATSGSRTQGSVRVAPPSSNFA